MNDFLEQLSLFSTPDTKDIKKETIIWNLYIDGASRHNPGKSGIGIYIIKNDTPFYQQGFYTGIKTNNEAEYLALIVGLFTCKNYMLSSDTLDIFSDSQLVVKQILGIFRVLKPEIQVLHKAALNLLQGTQFYMQYIERERNSQADKLANQGIDTQQPLPNNFVSYARTQGIIL